MENTIQLKDAIDKNGFSIGEVARQTGLSAHTLRFYEKEGLLPFVTKNSSGVRVYTTEDLQWLTMKKKFFESPDDFDKKVMKVG